MGKVKRNLLTSVLLLVVMGIFAVLTIFVVVDAVNKKYYEDLNVDYEVQEEAPNIILTFARHEGSEVNNTTTKVVLNNEKDKFRLDGVVPEVTDGTVTNLDEITNENGGEFYFFSTNPAFIDVQETPEDPNLIFNDTDIRYYVSTADNPIWYDVPTENVFTLYSVFLTPNVHNADFASAPLNTITNAIVSHDVVDLPANAFEGSPSTSSALTTILLPQNLQSIGNYSFQYCGNLTSITIPSTVTSIGSWAFYNCTGLTSITIPSTVTSIENYAFYNCTGFTIVTFEEGSELVSIGKSAFSDCDSLTSITIPESVTSIGKQVFNSCESLTTVTFEEGSELTSIGGYAFYNCDILTSITIPEGITAIEDYTFHNCNALTNFTIPSTVTSIGSGAFESCERLTSITIPSSVTSIGAYAFRYCDSLTSITIPSTVTSIGGYAFYSCSGLTTVTFEEGSELVSIGNYAFYSCRGLITVTFEEGSKLTSIGSYAFRYCNSLTSITIPSSVTSIGSEAFRYCYNIQELHIDNLTSYLNISYADIYARPLYETNQSVTLYINGEAVTALKISEDITSIPYYAFSNCNFTSVTIPSGVTSIGSNAFYECYRLAEVINLSSLNIEAKNSSNGYVGYYAIEIKTSGESGIYTLDENKEFIMYKDSAGNHYLVSYVGSDTEIVLPTLADGQTYSINDYAFYNNDNITNITIPSFVTSIESYAFYSCNSLTSIAIPESVTSIGSSAFEDCTNIQELYIDNLTSYLNISYAGNSARPLYVTDQSVTLYINGEAVTALTISEDIISIPNYAFYNCNFTSVTIPSSVTSIGEYAFCNCTGLTSITIPSTVTSIGNDAFNGCYRLVEVINLSSLNITAGNSSNGYAGYYADYIYTSLDTPLKQQSVGDYIFYLNDDVMYLLAYEGNDADLTLPSVERVKEIFTDYTGSSYQIYEYAFYNNDNITSITIPSSVTSIGDYAFSNCTGLTTVTFEEGSKLSSIRSGAFENCKSLTSITIPSSVTSIGSWAFEDCSSLTSITIPEGVTGIGSYAFNNCTGLTSITIPEGVTSIGSYAFRYCDNLTTYCEVESKPSGWDRNWNYSSRPIYWGLGTNWEYDSETGEPRPIGE